MIYYAPAKINLSLDIIKKRKDGYHELKMIMQTISLYDEITIEKADKITVLCSDSNIPSDETNLGYKAADLFFKATDIKGGCNIKINKKIPSGAGLGGGSSDAAEILIALNNIYKTNLSDTQLKNIAVKLGADVPFFINKGTCLAEGIGEILTPIENKLNPYILIYKPKFSISTVWAYKNFKLKTKKIYNIEIIKDSLKNGNKELFCNNLFNVLEDVVLSEYNEIENIKNKMKLLGAEASLMTGSGSAVFGVFFNKLKAENAFNQFKNEQVFLTNFC